nr:hypothetical protein [Planococcus glaciei]
MVNQKTDAIRYDVIVVRNSDSYDYLSFEGSLVEVSGSSVKEIVAEVEERLQRAGKNQRPAECGKRQIRRRILRRSFKRSSNRIYPCPSNGTKKRQGIASNCKR